MVYRSRKYGRMPVRRFKRRVVRRRRTTRVGRTRAPRRKAGRARLYTRRRRVATNTVKLQQKINANEKSNYTYSALHSVNNVQSFDLDGSGNAVSKMGGYIPAIYLANFSLMEKGYSSDGNAFDRRIGDKITVRRIKTVLDMRLTLRSYAAASAAGYVGNEAEFLSKQQRFMGFNSNISIADVRYVDVVVRVGHVVGLSAQRAINYATYIPAAEVNQLAPNWLRQFYRMGDSGVASPTGGGVEKVATANSGGFRAKRGYTMRRRLGIPRAVRVSGSGPPAEPWYRMQDAIASGSAPMSRRLSFTIEYPTGKNVKFLTAGALTFNQGNDFNEFIYIQLKPGPVLLEQGAETELFGYLYDLRVEQYTRVEYFV